MKLHKLVPEVADLRRRHPAISELLLVGVGLLVYYLTRGGITDTDHHDLAQQNAAKLIEVEQRLGLFWEPAWNTWAMRRIENARFWNMVYFWAHAPLIVTVGIWLLHRHRPTYRLIRNSFLVSAVAGLISYRFFPVAPPRLVPGYGFVDTMRDHSKLSYQAQSLGPFVNPYAAVPSLHFGWSFLIFAGMVLASPARLWLWGAGFGQSALILVSIVATANHWLLDAVAGFGVCLGSLIVATIHSRLTSKPRR
jgi:hypothetical protein